MKNAIALAISFSLFPCIFNQSPGAPTRPTNEEIAHLEVKGRFEVQNLSSSPSLSFDSLFLKPTFKNKKGELFLNTSGFHHPFLQMNLTEYGYHQALFDSRTKDEERVQSWELSSGKGYHFFPLRQLLDWME